MSPGSFELHFILRKFDFPGRITRGVLRYNSKTHLPHTFLNVHGELNLLFACANVKEKERCIGKKKKNSNKKKKRTFSHLTEKYHFYSKNINYKVCLEIKRISSCQELPTELCFMLICIITKRNCV